MESFYYFDGSENDYVLNSLKEGGKVNWLIEEGACDRNLEHFVRIFGIILQYTCHHRNTIM